jgi:phage terminase large subunit
MLIDDLFKTTDVFTANLNADKDIVINQGGTSSGKTYAIIQCLFVHAIKDPGVVITVVGQDIPNLKVGALRDAQTIVGNSPQLQGYISSYNKSDRVYEFITGSIIEFKSYDDWQDAKSGKRDYLFINEANGIPVLVWQELHMRTRKRSYIDYNPNTEFWVHQNLIGNPNVELIISDHRHNTFLDQKVHDRIEGITDPEMWKVYARGLTGKLEGIIFRNYNVVPEMPTDGRFIAYGLDWGYTNDPTALIEVRMFNGELFIDELIYERGLLNSKISEEMKFLGVSPRREIVADSAEPKSIAELNSYGWFVSSAQKGADSVRSSIDILKGYKLNITQRSVNLKKELNSYKWKQDKSGVMVNEPVDYMNHSIDALRYVALNKLAQEQQGKYVFI